MTPLFLLMLFPILTIVGMKVWRSENFTWLEAGAQLLLTVVCVVGLYQGGRYAQMTSVEFWTGTVQSKSHDDDYYTTSYCCATDSKGNCTSTCYTDHYTREWFLSTTVGRIETSSIDTEWRSSRDSFDSDAAWNGAYKGEACSKINPYLNYVQAAKFSLLNRGGTHEQFAKAGLLPAYPQLHGIYKLNRVLDLGVGVPNLSDWQRGLDDYMKNLGGLKQINIFVIFVPTIDPAYKAALEAHWRGANKNDTIIIIGVDNGTKTIDLVDVITWAKEPIYKLTLIDSLRGVKHLDDEKTPALALSAINEATLSLYERRPMVEFEYLKDEIDPPTWVLVLSIIFAIPGSLALAFLFDRIDLYAMLNRGRSYRRNSGIRIRRRRF
jgi:hypothetical protein